jgi:hypothetical protein
MNTLYENLKPKLLSYNDFGSVIGAKYNAALVALHTTGENLFTTELLTLMVTGPRFCKSERQMDIIKFVCEKITPTSTPQAESKPSYTPNWAKHPHAKYWTIDDNGYAYFYASLPYIREVVEDWGTNDYSGEYDSDFNGSEYPELWQGDNWRQSLLSKQEVTEYKPDWSDFPDAKYWAIDADGEAYFYDRNPTIQNDFWYAREGRTRLDYNFLSHTGTNPLLWKDGNWRTTLRGKA